jgi:putative transposase
MADAGGFDEKIIALYARGMSVRDIQAHLAELYRVEVGHNLISRVTDAVEGAKFSPCRS